MLGIVSKVVVTKQPVYLESQLKGRGSILLKGSTSSTINDLYLSCFPLWHTRRIHKRTNKG